MKKQKKNKVVIINCCGFDSIPVDLGSYFTLQQFKEDERDDVQISGFLKASGSPSYGTWSTLMYSLTNQFSLLYRKKEEKSNNTEIKNVKKKVRAFIGYNNDLKVYQIPFPSSDPLIVSRSTKLLNLDFNYCNYFTINTLCNFVMFMFGVIFIVFLIQTKFGLNIALWLGPKEGGGPSKEVRTKSWFKFTFFGKNKNNKKVTTKVSGKDPGYDETSKMLSESAFRSVSNMASAHCQVFFESQ